MGKTGDFLKEFEHSSSLYSKKVMELKLSAPVKEINFEETPKPIQTVKDYVKFIVKKVYEFNCGNLQKKSDILNQRLLPNILLDIERLNSREMINDSSLMDLFNKKHSLLKIYSRALLKD